MIQTLKVNLEANVRSTVVSVGGDGDGVRVLLYNETHGNHYCALGDHTVNLTNGIHFYGGEKLQLTVEAGESLYAYATEAIDLRVMIMGAFD